MLFIFKTGSYFLIIHNNKLEVTFRSQIFYPSSLPSCFSQSYNRQDLGTRLGLRYGYEMRLSLPPLPPLFPFFVFLQIFRRQWQPLLARKEICLTTTSSAETEIIISDLHSSCETFDYISHLSYLKSILGLVNPRDLCKTMKLLFTTIFRFPRNQNGNLS